MDQGTSLAMKEIREGKGTFFVPDNCKDSSARGPGKRMGTFYNPAMEVDRNISVLLLSAVIDDMAPKILDALCASGIRGIRYAQEMPYFGNFQPSVTLNDISPSACVLAEKNARSSSRPDAFRITCGNAQALLCDERFAVVDLDPYGPSVPFLDSALNGVRHGGILAFTATDTAVACGTYQRACRRRYQASGIRNFLCHEAGLRIVIGHAVRRAAEQDIALVPLHSYYYDHYFRVFARVEKNRNKACRMLESLAVGVYDPELGDVKDTPWIPGCTSERGDKSLGHISFGPYWSGIITSRPVVEKMLNIMGGIMDGAEADVAENLGKKRQTLKLLEHWIDEAELPPFFKNTDDVGKICGYVPGRDAMVELLIRRGFYASRTHFLSTGIKTDASLADMASAMKE